MARSSGSGKKARTFPAKRDSYKPSQAEKSEARRNTKEEAVVTTANRNYTFKEVEPLNFIQGEYLDAIKHNDIVFGIGSAGTGKTFIAASYAASELFHRRIDKVILTRPNVETGRGLGFLPGTLEEKYAPYLLPFDSIFTKALGKGFYEYCLKNKDIEPTPLGFLRGTTFDNCIVLVDEAQNCSKEEMKMLLSRIGKNCKMILSGDTEQSDIPNSGLEDAVTRLEGISGIEVIEFLDEDIVRSAICKKIIMAYRD
jgi:phosphate starvation-inducible PhoH-like protein